MSEQKDKDDGGSAFPQIGSEQVGSHGEYHTEVSSYGGMTLRDYFAGKAMSEVFAVALRGRLPINREQMEAIARSVWLMADVMIAGRGA